MAVKTCCIDNCNSSSSRKEDAGVTYHKYPKDLKLCSVWVQVTRHECNSNVIQYVCSRHFCKSDFKTYKDSKYILKSDAIPSIFPWTMANVKHENVKEDDITEENIHEEMDNKVTTQIETNKDAEIENLDAIKQFIENQERVIADSKISGTSENVECTSEAETGENKNENDSKNNEMLNAETLEDKMALATSMMDMIMSESDAKIDEKKVKSAPKGKISSAEKISGNSMALTVGSKVEAKDFGEFWHTAEITEVDFEEMEVLVHYDDGTKKHDEWISVSSPRLRPKGSGPPQTLPTPKPEPVTIKTEPATSPVPSVKIKEEPKEKSKFTFEVGERCLARWRDNRRFIATINAYLGDNIFEVIFDDKTKWTCNIVRLSKLKDGSQKDHLTVDTGGPPTCSTPSPVGLGPTHDGSVTTPPAGLPFNTHLFDPSRDYLSSKSERRAMKRKLNIKEIFNIGQKKKKIETPPPKRSAPKPKPTQPKESTQTKPKTEPKSTPEPKSTTPSEPKTQPKSTTDSKPKTESETATKPKATTQTKPPTPKVVKDVKPKVVKKKSDAKVKTDVPDAVASIIGTVPKDPSVDMKKEVKEEIKSEDDEPGDIRIETIDIDAKMDIDDLDMASSETLSAPESHDMNMKIEEDSLLAEAKLEKFDKQDENKHEAELDRIKEAIIKLEDGISKAEIKTGTDPKLEVKETDVELKKALAGDPKDKKNLVKIKKSKVKLKREKKVKKQVEKVKSELEEMKKQVEEMRKQMSEEMSKKHTEMPESFLLPGEWCCKWVNGQPVGRVSEIEHEAKVDANNKPVLARRSVQVEDKRLPPGWTKHMVRRSLGSSAGKWDVVLMSPDNHRFHTKSDMKSYLEKCTDEGIKAYEPVLMDFGMHLKLSRRMGWYTTTPDGKPQAPMEPVPAGLLTASPLVKRKNLSLKRGLKEKKRQKLRMKLKVPPAYRYENYESASDGSGWKLAGASGTSRASGELLQESNDLPPENMPLEDGCVYVGSLKVQIIQDLLRCPAEGCFKNFRNNTLLKMHIKHYHRELRKMLGATPKVLDLAYARTRPSAVEMRRLKLEQRHKKIRAKLNRPKRPPEVKLEINKELADVKPELQTPVKEEPKLPKIPRSQDSPKLRTILSKPVKRPKVLLPVVRRIDDTGDDEKDEDVNVDDTLVEPKVEVPTMGVLDFETAISTHTVTKPADLKRKDKKKKFAAIAKTSEDEEWYGVNSDVETRSSYPRSGTPDSKMDQKLVSSESNEEQKEPNYMYTESGERIKIVHMKREEIINCHCGFREEDGLMVQCELCLCWQHALCHNIQKESEVPEKYTCSICLNPRRGRRSQRFLHDQDRLYEGLLPGTRGCETLRRSHELSGNLHRVEDALHALRVKYIVATNKNHPKLYLWASDWEHNELTLTQEKLNSDYSDLSIMISGVGKENLPADTRPPSSEGRATPDRYQPTQEHLPADTRPPSSEGRATPDRYQPTQEHLPADTRPPSSEGRATPDRYQPTQEHLPADTRPPSSEGRATPDRYQPTQEHLPADTRPPSSEGRATPDRYQPTQEHLPADTRPPSSEGRATPDRYSHKDSGLGSQALLSGLLSSPGAASLDLPITTTELEKLAKTVEAEQAAARVIAPQPEAAIENSACRERLLRHIQRCQALIDARLDSVEAQVAELESQDPSFEDDETADYFPRTKQTIQMMMRDLDTMEELGVIT
ncbi:hypothetical protein O0L34_g8266 [Tuta absoluta]|nr:hypothetical protein O0L34_g8266 [Tuta absoluta]